jgi:hypothetical protein
MTREPGNLPMVVVPWPGGVYRAHATRRAIYGPALLSP